MKQCSKCLQVFEKSNFYRDKKGKDGLKSQCKQCSKSEYISWRKENPDKVRANVKKYKETLKGKANKKSNSAKSRARGHINLTKTEEEEIFKFYLETEKLRKRGFDVTVDHIIPLNGKTVSGLHVPWNLQILLASENYFKQNSLPPR
jgi:5-methylcytosine-specific restriction endonuclease McrA